LEERVAEDVNQAIARYLKKIHDEVLRPVVLEPSSQQYRPDRLVLFQEVFMRSYFRSVSLFRRPRKSNSRNVPIGAMRLSTMECQADEDCNDNEKCIYGECVPIPFDVEFAPISAPPSYGDEVPRAFESYSARINELLANGLARNPRRLEGVRNELMRLYAEAALAAGTARDKCEETHTCEDGQWCVAGICVDIPFRLVFRPLSGSRPKPRAKKS